MKWLTPCRDMPISIFIICCFSHQLLRTLPWLVFHDLRFVWILIFYPKTLHKTVYETINSFQRRVYFYFRLFPLFSPIDQDFTMACFPCYYACLDTNILPENAQQHWLWYCQLVVEMCLFLFLSYFPISQQLLRTLTYLAFHDLELVLILKQSLNTLYKTIYKIVASL